MEKRKILPLPEIMPGPTSPLLYRLSYPGFPPVSNKKKIKKGNFLQLL
jgi:hypothetical protein